MAFGEMTRHDMVILPGQGFLMRIASGRERGERRRVMRNTLTRLVPQTKTTPKSWNHANGVTRGTPGNQNVSKFVSACVCFAQTRSARQERHVFISFESKPGYKDFLCVLCALAVKDFVLFSDLKTDSNFKISRSKGS